MYFKLFWSEQWKKEEIEADEDIKSGNVKSFHTIDDLIADLDSDEE